MAFFLKIETHSLWLCPVDYHRSLQEWVVMVPLLLVSGKTVVLHTYHHLSQESDQNFLPWSWINDKKYQQRKPYCVAQDLNSLSILSWNFASGNGNLVLCLGIPIYINFVQNCHSIQSHHHALFLAFDTTMLHSLWMSSWDMKKQEIMTAGLNDGGSGERQITRLNVSFFLTIVRKYNSAKLN